MESRRAKLEEQLEALKAQGLDTPPPYSVTKLDQLQSDLHQNQEKIESFKVSITAAESSVELANDELTQLQARRRRLLDRRSQMKPDPSLTQKLARIGLSIEAVKLSKEVAEKEVEIARKELANQELRAEIFQFSVSIVEQGFTFTRETLQEQLSALEEVRVEITETLKAAQISQKFAEQKLQILLTDEIPDQEQTAIIAARREWVQTHLRKERLLEERLEYNLIRQDLWQRRFQAYQGGANVLAEEWAEQARGIILRLQRNRETLVSELASLRGEFSNLLDDEPEESGVDVESNLEEAIELRTGALVARQNAIEEMLTKLTEIEALAQRLIEEVAMTEKSAPTSERLRSIWRGLVSFWNIELYTLGDSAVTVGKLSVALTILILGLAFTSKFINLLSSRFLRKLPLREAVQSNLERVLRYVVWLLVFLFALHVVNIPLTIFTFLGGTLAIAVGFGAQNILNNFISGLILMVEQPVRTGDLIEVDGITGFVEEIGARSTRVRIPSGIHIIVPNASLLENKVTNWTLKDHRLRIKAEVGVVYGSPTRKVIELITKACKGVDRVHSTPAPIVTFTAFGDSSLNFAVHFWVTVASPLERDTILSQVHLGIDDLFRENSISIPFPQRDLNFNKPVPVKILNPDDSQASSGLKEKE